MMVTVSFGPSHSRYVRPVLQLWLLRRVCCAAVRHSRSAYARAQQVRPAATHAEVQAVLCGACRAMEYMRQHESYFSCFFAEGELQQYLVKMGQSKNWGDELTLRAVADACDCIIHVLASTKDNWYIKYVPSSSSPSKHLFLTYISPVHYNALTLL